MYIEDDKLRVKINEVLKTKSKHYIVQEIRSYGFKFQQYHLDNFMQNKPVNLETLKKIDMFVSNNI
jgi:hypothetical protein